MKKFKHTNEELEEARRISLKLCIKCGKGKCIC